MPTNRQLEIQKFQLHELREQRALAMFNCAESLASALLVHVPPEMLAELRAQMDQNTKSLRIEVALTQKEVRFFLDAPDDPPRLLWAVTIGEQIAS